MFFFFSTSLTIVTKLLVHLITSNLHKNVNCLKNIIKTKVINKAISYLNRSGSFIERRQQTDGQKPRNRLPQPPSLVPRKSLRH